MVVDKVGGIGPNYGPRKTERAAKADLPTGISDNVTISDEASRAAEAAKVARMARQAPDTERAERVKEVKAKMDRGEYNNLSDEVLNRIADRIMGTSES